MNGAGGGILILEGFGFFLILVWGVGLVVVYYIIKDFVGIVRIFVY